MGAFADPGLGASPVWHVFAIDQAGIVFGEATGVVGDQRIRIDLGALRILGDGLAWAPGNFFNQDGSPDPYCSRGALRRAEDRLAAAGIDAAVGHEMEFVLVGPDGGALPSDLWAQYGLAGVLEYEGFVRDVTDAATSSGVAIEQFHPEYGAQPVRDLADPAVARRCGRPVGADEDHRRPGGAAVRSARQPLPGTLCGQRGIGFPPTFFIAEGRYTAFL